MRDGVFESWLIVYGVDKGCWLMVYVSFIQVVHLFGSAERISCVGSVLFFRRSLVDLILSFAELLDLIQGILS